MRKSERTGVIKFQKIRSVRNVYRSVSCRDNNFLVIPTKEGWEFVDRKKSSTNKQTVQTMRFGRSLQLIFFSHGNHTEREREPTRPLTNLYGI